MVDTIAYYTGPLSSGGKILVEKVKVLYLALLRMFIKSKTKYLPSEQIPGRDRCQYTD